MDCSCQSCIESAFSDIRFKLLHVNNLCIPLINKSYIIFDLI